MAVSPKFQKKKFPNFRTFAGVPPLSNPSSLRGVVALRRRRFWCCQMASSSDG